MAKDPAFLFYSSDFLTGTLFMTDSQVGKYIKLMCLQHQKGHLTESEMKRVCGENKDDQDVIFEKFSTDKSGKYFNKRLEEEIEKRKKHSKRQKENALKRWNKSGSVDIPEESQDDAEVVPNGCHGIADAMPLENENENENENSSFNKMKEIPDELKITVEKFIEMRKKIKAPMTNYAIELMLKKLNKLSGGDTDKSIAILEQSIMNGWKGVFELKPEQKAKENWSFLDYDV